MKNAEYLLIGSLVMMIMIPSLAIGYAVPSYTSEMVCSDNTNTAGYFTIGLYTDEDCTVACTDIFKADGVYQKVTDQTTGDITYSITDDTELTHNGENGYQLYLRIASANMNGTYSVSTSCDCSFIRNGTPTEIRGASIIATLTDLDDTIPSEIADGIYKLSLTSYGLSAVMAGDPTSLSISILLIVRNISMGTYIDSPETMTITAESSITIVDEETAAEALTDANENNTSID